MTTLLALYNCFLDTGWKLTFTGNTNLRLWWVTAIITLRPRQDGRYFAHDTFKRIFLNENVIVAIKISLKFVAKGPINNIPAFVQIMAWRRPGEKPLSEPMFVFVPTNICVSRPQWVWILTIIGWAWTHMAVLFVYTFEYLWKIYAKQECELNCPH